MQKLGWLVIVTIVTLGLVGYHRNQIEPISLTTPTGYAAPVPIPKTSWKDAIPTLNDPLAPPQEQVLILEMAPDKPAVSPVKEVKRAMELKKAKAKKGTRHARAKTLRKRSKIH